MNKLGEQERATLQVIVDSVVQTAVHLFRDKLQDELWKNRFGGAFCYASHSCGTEMIFLAGEAEHIPSEKLPKYIDLCQEKTRRLAEYPNHHTSWQSRSPENDHWGGAARFKNRTYSFSGLPEKGDEAAMLLVIILHNSEDDEVRPWAKFVAQVSRNPYFEPLLEQLDNPEFIRFIMERTDPGLFTA